MRNFTGTVPPGEIPHFFYSSVSGCFGSPKKRRLDPLQWKKGVKAIARLQSDTSAFRAVLFMMISFLVYFGSDQLQYLKNDYPKK